jgi:hypothetical protein
MKGVAFRSISRLGNAFLIVQALRLVCYVNRVIGWFYTAD